MIVKNLQKHNTDGKLLNYQEKLSFNATLIGKYLLKKSSKLLAWNKLQFLC